MSEYVIRHGRRIAVETLESKVPAKPKRIKRDQFVQVPLIWVERLQAARCVGSYRLALHLLFQHWKSGGKPIKLSNAVLSTPKAKWRALRELERLELISVERSAKKSPRVMILVSA